MQVYRNPEPTIELPLSASTYTDVLMGENNLVFSFTDSEVLDIQVGDYITYKGQRMEVNSQPEVSRNHKLDYVIQFDGLRHRLSRFKIKNEGSLTFSYFGDLSDYMSMFLGSINGVDSSWTVGDLEEVEPFALEFDKVDHLTALSMICEACKCEWKINGKEITILNTVGMFRDYPMQYGKDNGLYKITRKSIQNGSIITRGYAVGGTQNLPANYPHKQFTLPDYYEDEDAVALFGIREGIFEDQDIFPKRTAEATAVGQINDSTFTLTDSTIDFDLDGQRIDGEEAYIVFKSGMLNGQQFKILSYNNATKTIRYEANKDSNGNLLPFGAVVAEIGDSYTLIGIRMPESYVTNALNELAEKREEYVNSNKVPRVVYDALVDPLDLKRNNMQLEVGDILPFIDDKIGLDDNLRITKVSYTGTYPNLHQGSRFEIEIGQEVSYTRFEKIEIDIKTTKQVVTQYTKQSWENDRRNVQAINEFKGKVFDPDGNLQNALIQGIAALFGSESMYFDLEDIELAINASGDENRLVITAGKLIHRQYEITGLGYIWNLSAFDQDGLEPLKSYYLAAKVSRTALTGEWVLSESQLATESEAGYWHFNLGVLSSVIEGVRSFNPTRLFTLISGGNVLTDVVTARLINVQKLFAQIIEVGSNGYTNAGISGVTKEVNPNTSVRFWAGQTADNRDSAPFSVLNDGSMSSSKGKIGGFVIDSTTLRSENIDSGGTPTAASSGIILSDLGVLSRNAGMSFLAASTGFDFAASLVGEVSEARPSIRPVFIDEIRAGVFGIRRQELTTAVLSLLEGAWGRYGAMFTSTKFLSAIYEPIRVDSSNSDLYLTENDYYVAKGGSGDVYLPSVGVEKGRKIIIKNAHSANITINGNGYEIYRTNNTSSMTTIFTSGLTITFRFSGAQWIESDAG